MQNQTKLTPARHLLLSYALSPRIPALGSAVQNFRREELENKRQQRAWMSRSRLQPSENDKAIPGPGS